MLDSVLFYPLFFLVGIAAGTIDSIAGGGGLITLPSLLAIGLPPHIALGTNKFQSSFGSFTASYYYYKHGQVDLKESFPGIAYTFIGTVLGTFSVQLISRVFLNYLIPVLLVCIIIYTFFTPKLGDIDRKPGLTSKQFYFIFGLVLGFYDGFFGPGTGSFWAMAFVIGLGFNLTKATGYTKVINFTSNITSLLVFTLSGNVVLLAGLVMGIGEIIGAKIGSGLVIKRGAKFIRPVFIAIVILTTLKLIYDRLL
jgi:uncharacterized membrane protein YfcA